MSLPSVKKDKVFELKKHINLIHCSNKFSLVQRKLYNALLYNAFPELASRNIFTISAKMLCELTGYNSNDYKSLREALLGLVTMVVEWNVLDSTNNVSGDKWGASSAISSVVLENGICIYEYSSVMKELIHRPEIYGRINMSLLPKFKSMYGLTLYENCIRYQGIPQTPWMDIETFRKLMGVRDSKYPIFRDLKRRVLDIAVREVNEHSPISVFPEIKRSNKNVTNVRFRIELKKDSETPILVNDKKSDGLVNTLKGDFNLSVKSIECILADYQPDYILEKINLILNSGSYKAGKINDMAGYLISSLKEDFSSPKSSRILVDALNQETNKREMEEKQKLEKAKILYKQYKTLCVNKYIASLSQEDFMIHLDNFGQYLRNADPIAYNKWYLKEGIEDFRIKFMFDEYLINTCASINKEIVGFNEFKNRV